MLPKLALGLAALIALALALRWFVRTPPSDVTRVLKRALLWGAAALLIVLAATGRLHWLFATIGALVALLPRLIWYVPLLGGIYRRYRAARSTLGGATPRGQASQVETRFVRMSLDHDSGEIDGLVLDGRFKGARLSELPIPQLVELLRECRLADTESARLVEAFLDRTHGDEWRAAAGDTGDGTNDPSGGTPMSPEEAYEILGLAPGASEEEIVAAHRRLMQKLHPDRGGSGYLAAKINQAKDLLLEGKRKRA